MTPSPFGGRLGWGPAGVGLATKIAIGEPSPLPSPRGRGSKKATFDKLSSYDKIGCCACFAGVSSYYFYSELACVAREFPLELA
jgi:hypothetical protein